MIPIGMQFGFVLTLLIAGFIGAIFMQFTFRYRVLEGVDGFSESELRGGPRLRSADLCQDTGGYK